MGGKGRSRLRMAAGGTAISGDATGSRGLARVAAHCSLVRCRTLMPRVGRSPHGDKRSSRSADRYRAGRSILTLVLWEPIKPSTRPTDMARSAILPSAVGMVTVGLLCDGCSGGGDRTASQMEPCSGLVLPPVLQHRMVSVSAWSCPKGRAPDPLTWSWSPGSEPATSTRCHRARHASVARQASNRATARVVKTGRTCRDPCSLIPLSRRASSRHPASERPPRARIVLVDSHPWHVIRPQDLFAEAVL